MNRQALIEAVKEAARLAILAAIAAVLLYVGDLVNALDPTSLQYMIGTALLRIADRYVHKNPEIPANGISPV